MLPAANVATAKALSDPYDAVYGVSPVWGAGAPRVGTWVIEPLSAAAMRGGISGGVAVRQRGPTAGGEAHER